MRNLLSLVLLVGLTSCGGGGIPAEPLVSGNVTGSYDGTAFTPINGFATMKGSSYLIVLGTGAVGCGSEDSSSPPAGYSVAIQPSAFTVGTYANTFVNLYKNVGGFEGNGSTNGTVMITSVTDETVAGSISYDYTNASNETYTVTGTFEVVHCAY